MARVKVSVENFAEFIHDQLAEYAEDMQDNIAEATHKIALAGVRALKAESPGKKYPKGWRTWSETTRLQQKETIYNSDMPGIPHLLEHGHAMRNGGRSPAIVHIKPVEEELIKAFEEEVAKAIDL